MYAEGKCMVRDLMGYKIIKKKKAQEAWVIWREKKRGKNEVGKQRIGEKKRATKSSFIHTGSSNYQCIYSIP